ncbi:hypothetical protein NMBB_0872 [Neisseria meningitidis alpha710]|uniref:Uncharacterized protein n=1 Tax=Neisseria meningitidis alpha153 TaxID=663926 RepID=C6SAZ7_NEIME|nr:hypothetical protein NMBB_0872 [Neisseria meningitidis alpha710]CBA04414.1 hypothetical protein predicted by Glimmer/Critica [Neisseria meningitidis alpha153]
MPYIAQYQCCERKYSHSSTILLSGKWHRAYPPPLSSFFTSRLPPLAMQNLEAEFAMPVRNVLAGSRQQRGHAYG